MLYDIGVVETKEPFQKLFNQGMILGEGNEKMSNRLGMLLILMILSIHTVRIHFVYMKCSWGRLMHRKHGLRMALTVHVDSLTDLAFICQ